MTIEDIVLYLRLSRIGIPTWDQQLVNSISDQFSQGLGLTEKQDTVVRRILKKHKEAISLKLSKDISPFLENPNYRNPIRKISYDKKISVDTDSNYGKIIKMIFPYNEEYVNKIRKHRDNSMSSAAAWDKDQKSWNFSLGEENINFLMNFSQENDFEIDKEFSNFVEQTKNIISNMEKYAITLGVENSVPYLKNSNKFIPKLESDKILDAIFESRRRGIFIWDEQISEFVENIQNDTTKRFLKSAANENLHVDPENSSLFSLEDVVKYMSPSLFVIPGIEELEKLKEAFFFLSKIGIKNEEMSVMFRLPTDTHQNFNNFVKEQQLNSPLTEKTQIVFVSGKLPKPILKSKIKFHCVVNMGFPNVHYTLKDYVKNQENVVFFVHKKEYRNRQFELV
jgi:hypothetical protein